MSEQMSELVRAALVAGCLVMSGLFGAASIIASAIAANKESRFTAPEVGAIRKCLVCALDREWGIFSEATGETICRICRDRARHMPTPYEETTEQGTFYKDNMPIGEYWRAEFDKYIALQSERERAAYQRGAAAAANKESPQRKAFVEAAIEYAANPREAYRAMIEAEKVETEKHAEGCRCPECDPNFNDPREIDRLEAERGEGT